MNSDFSSEDFFDSEEPSYEYMHGGYCALDIGDTLISTYFIIRKLGWGFSSTVWLCWNIETSSYVAVKVMKGAPKFLHITRNEVQLLKITISNHHEYQNHVVKFLDHFTVLGDNGVHACIVFELAGQTLSEFKSINYLNMNCMKDISRQILKGLYYLHEVCDLVHTDLKHDNILVLTSETLGQKLALEVYEVLNTTNVPRDFTSNLPENKRKIRQPSNEYERPLFESKVIEYHKFLQNEMERLGIIHMTYTGSSNSSSSHYTSDSYEWGVANPGDFRRPVDYYSTNFKPQRRKHSEDNDEKIFVKIADLGYAYKNNAFEFDYIQAREFRAAEVVLGGKLGKPVDIWSTACITYQMVTGEYLFDPNLNDFQHIERMTEILGDIPDKVCNQSRLKAEFYDEDGKLLSNNVEQISLTHHLQERGFSKSESLTFSDLILSMLHWDSDERFTAAQCLNHPWFHSY